MVFLKKYIIPLIVSIILFMEYLDMSVINTAIPSIARDFGESPLLLKLAVTSYLLGLAIFLPISGWITDKFGTKKVLITSVFIFTLASFACSTSNSIFSLSCFRFLQGIGGAFMNPTARILVVRSFHKEEFVKIQGIIFTPAMLGYVLGPVLGGIFSTYLNWNWIFYINIPTGILIVLLCFKYVPQYIEKNVKKFDFIGFIFIATSLSFITFSVDMIDHYNIVSRNIVMFYGILGLILFFISIIHCLKVKNPVLDYTLFKLRTFKLTNIINFFNYMCSGSINFLLPFMFQDQFKFTAAKSGLTVLPIAIGYLVFRPLAPKILHRYGFKMSMIFTSTLSCLMLIMLSFITKDTSIYKIYSIEFIYGSSYIVFASAAGALMYFDISKDCASRATAIDATLRQFSSSFGIGLCAILIIQCSNFLNVSIFSSHGIIVFKIVFYFLVLFIFSTFLTSLFYDKNDGISTK